MAERVTELGRGGHWPVKGAGGGGGGGERTELTTTATTMDGRRGEARTVALVVVAGSEAQADPTNGAAVPMTTRREHDMQKEKCTIWRCGEGVGRGRLLRRHRRSPRRTRGGGEGEFHTSRRAEDAVQYVRSSVRPSTGR